MIDKILDQLYSAIGKYAEAHDGDFPPSIEIHPKSLHELLDDSRWARFADPLKPWRLNGIPLIKNSEIKTFKILNKVPRLKRRDDMRESKEIYPIFDILERLFLSNHTIDYQDEEWWLFDKTGEGLISGKSLRSLCINIILAGIDYPTKEDIFNG